VQRLALRAQRSPPRYPRRPLRAQPADQGRRGAAVRLKVPKLRQTAIIERYRNLERVRLPEDWY
jgi:hypothetical protein